MSDQTAEDQDEIERLEMDLAQLPENTGAYGKIAAQLAEMKAGSAGPPELDDEPDEPPADGPSIPKERLDEVLASNRAKDAELAQARADLAAIKAQREAELESEPEPAYDPSEDINEMWRLQEEGDKDAATALFAKVLEQAAENGAKAAFARVGDVERIATERSMGTMALQRMVEANPSIDPQSPEFDESIYNDAERRVRINVKGGMSQADAVVQAVEDAVRAHDKTPGTGRGLAGALEDARSKSARVRAEPPAPHVAGRRTDRPDSATAKLARMSRDEFEREWEAGRITHATIDAALAESAVAENSS